MTEERKCELHQYEIDALHDKYNNLVKKVDDMSEIAVNTIKLTTLMEIVIEEGKKRDRALEKHADAMAEISRNMTRMGESLKDLHEDTRNIKSEMGDLRKRVEETDDKSKIEVWEMFQKFIGYLVTAGLGGYVVQFFMKK